jgi:hypothetical protein
VSKGSTKFCDLLDVIITYPDVAFIDERTLHGLLSPGPCSGKQLPPGFVEHLTADIPPRFTLVFEIHPDMFFTIRRSTGLAAPSVLYEEKE